MEADEIGEGGGCPSSRGEVTPSPGTDGLRGGLGDLLLVMGVPGGVFHSPLRRRALALFVDFVDLTDSASLLSPPVSVCVKLDVEFLGLSDLAVVPGILDLKARLNDLMDSLVSALANDG